MGENSKCFGSVTGTGLKTRPFIKKKYKKKLRKIGLATDLSLLQRIYSRRDGKLSFDHVEGLRLGRFSEFWSEYTHSLTHSLTHLFTHTLGKNNPLSEEVSGKDNDIEPAKFNPKSILQNEPSEQKDESPSRQRLGSVLARTLSLIHSLNHSFL